MNIENKQVSACVLLILLGNFSCGVLVAASGITTNDYWNLVFGCYIALASTVAAYVIEEK